MSSVIEASSRSNIEHWPPLFIVIVAVGAALATPFFYYCSVRGATIRPPQQLTYLSSPPVAWLPNHKGGHFRSHKFLVEKKFRILFAWFSENSPEIICFIFLLITKLDKIYFLLVLVRTVHWDRFVCQQMWRYFVMSYISRSDAKRRKGETGMEREGWKRRGWKYWNGEEGRKGIGERPQLMHCGLGLDVSVSATYVSCPRPMH